MIFGMGEISSKERNNESPCSHQVGKTQSNQSQESPTKNLSLLLKKIAIQLFFFKFTSIVYEILNLLKIIIMFRDFIEKILLQ